MGIKNLWQLLSPVGRSVSIETLAGKVSQDPLSCLTCGNERRIDTAVPSMVSVWFSRSCRNSPPTLMIQVPEEQRRPMRPCPLFHGQCGTNTLIRLAVSWPKGRCVFFAVEINTPIFETLNTPIILQSALVALVLLHVCLQDSKGSPGVPCSITAVNSVMRPVSPCYLSS